MPRPNILGEVILRLDPLSRRAGDLKCFDRLKPAALAHATRVKTFRYATPVMARLLSEAYEIPMEDIAEGVVEFAGMGYLLKDRRVLQAVISAAGEDTGMVLMED